jgi:hypothetical protein
MIGKLRSIKVTRWIPPQVQLGLRILAGKERHGQKMRFLRDLVGWWVPPAVQSIVLSTAYDLFGNVDVKKNLGLKDRHRGRRCFVIGNGPSLGKQDLKRLAGEITIGANSFYKHPDAAVVGLKYLCIGDPSFMTDEPKSVAWHRVIEERMPGTELVLQADALPLVRKHGLYSQHEIYTFRRGVTHFIPELLTFDLTRPIDVGSTTGTMLGIPLAFYLGASEIVLLGFDANWLESYAGSYHFYGKHEQFPEFDSPKADHRWPLYEDQLLLALRDYEAHRMIATRATQLGVKIVNATGGGLLDVYPRVDYASLI